MKMKFTPVFTLSMLFAVGAYAQTDSTGSNIEDLSLEDLMNVKVVSASKKAESAFDAPLSIGSVSREEIKRAGSTSIMEALRLVPGVIVREITSGNYDVSLRGMDNLPSMAPLNAASNSITLVMIDNRPVYNYFNGGTFWATLPIDLNDVEKIEVVRGPSTALYGPNAASGVINIITRKIQKQGFYSTANAQAGTPGAVISNASVGYKFKKFDFIVSGNQQYRQRTESDYYSWNTNSNMPIDSIRTSFPNAVLTDVNRIPNASARYPNQNVALNKYGVNAFMNYAISEKSTIGLSVGTQNSQNQQAFVDNLATPLTTAESNTQYADLRAKINNLSAQVSYNGGVQNVAVGAPGYKYKFNTVDAFVEYDIVLKNLSIKPGLNYRTATYDDSQYSDIANHRGFLNGSQTLSNIAGSLRGEYKLINDRLKFIAAGRLDKYNQPDKVYASYQFGVNFKINDNNLVRAVYSRAFRGPNMYDIYNNQSLYIGDQAIAPGVSVPEYANITGNRNINLLSIDMFELGYRAKATENLYFDLDVFYQVGKNFSFVAGDQTILPTATNPSISIPQTIVNIPLQSNQLGVTLSANYVVSKFQFKPFITVQQTQLTGVSISRNTVNGDGTPDKTDNLTITHNTKDSGTPSFYGGLYANYQVTPKFNINLNGYFFGASTYVGLANAIVGSNYGIAQNSAKVLINLKVSYKVIKQLDLFVNARNLANQTAYEFTHTDMTKIAVTGGVNFEF